MKMILTRCAPRWDSLTAAWLVSRFMPGFEDSEVRFTSVDSPDRELMRQADAMVDIGGFHNPHSYLYDYDNPNVAGAAMLVYEDLLHQHVAVSHLAPLVQLVYQGDSGKIEAIDSWTSGIHAALAQMKIEGMSNLELLRAGFMILDMISVALKLNISLKDSVSFVLEYGFDAFAQRFQHQGL